MKFAGTDIATLREAIAPLDTPEARVAYCEGRIPRAGSVKDIDKRYRWDLFWAAQRTAQIDLTPYNDAHIDTALRSIVNPLKVT